MYVIYIYTGVPIDLPESMFSKETIVTWFAPFNVAMLFTLGSRRIEDAKKEGI